MNDTFRYILIDESDKVESKSKTSFITIYEIDSINNYPSISIIDTPGFGDTRGKDFDEEIFKMINNLFNNFIDIIDAVCFVAKSSNNRLTDDQKYIMNNIFKIFGKDIAENVIPMLTFCNKGKPNILDCLMDKESVFYKYKYGDKDKNDKDDIFYLKFNNIKEFFEKKDLAEFKDYWKMGKENFQSFFEKLNNLKSKSLRVSTEIIEFRKKMGEKFLEIIQKYDEYFNLKNYKIYIENQLAQYKNLKNQSEDFIINKTEQEKIKTKVPIKKKSTSKSRQNKVLYKVFFNCTRCKKTCNKTLFNKNGKCKKCSCSKEIHKSGKFKYENKIKVYSVVDYSKKYQYLDNTNKLAQCENNLKIIQYDLNTIKKDFDNLHNELNDYKKFLELNLIDFNFDEEISNFFE